MDAESSSANSLVKPASRTHDAVSESSESAESERDWEREREMKELLSVSRGLLLHFPGSCRFNGGGSLDQDNCREEEDWNTYVRP